MTVNERAGGPRPTFEQYADVGVFIQGAVKRSSFWLVDWLAYGESRADWADRLQQVVDVTGLSPKTLRNARAVRAVAPSRRRAETVDFSHHVEIASLPPAEQETWLERCEASGWTVRDLRLNLRARKRAQVLKGQATLTGMFRVLYADPPWLYKQQPHASNQSDNFEGMTVEQLCKLPVAAHAMKDSVLFCWVTAPMLYYASDPDLGPDPYRVIRSWGFTPKTGGVWDKVAHVFGNYLSIRHEHLLICTRGSLTPDRPTPMIDSVITVRSRDDDEHSAKPEEFRQIIERLYDGPYLELFGRHQAKGWAVFGDDARLWAEEAKSA
jgi:N6-adenosine-specific RNA methylase IME4